MLGSGVVPQLERLPDDGAVAVLIGFAHGGASARRNMLVALQQFDEAAKLALPEVLCCLTDGSSSPPNTIRYFVRSQTGYSQKS